MTELDLAEPQRIGEQIRAIMKERGGTATVRELAVTALENGVWSEEQLAGVDIVWASKQVRKILESGEDMPFAAPIEKGREPVWQQISLINVVEKAIFIIGERVSHTQAYHHRTEHMHRDFQRKFDGGLPDLPAFR